MIKKSIYSLSNITNDDVTQFIDKQYLQQDKDLYSLRINCEEMKLPIIQRDVEMLMTSLLLLKSPKKILEIGTAVGYSAIMMYKLTGAEITTLERMEDMVEAAKVNKDNLGIGDKDIKIVYGDAMDTVRSLKGNKYDFVFIDASKSHYLDFWKSLKDYDMVDYGGVILCDNVLMRAMTVDDRYDLNKRHKTSIRRMREFLDYIMSDGDYSTSILPVGDGVSISFKL